MAIRRRSRIGSSSSYYIDIDGQAECIANLTNYLERKRVGIADAIEDGAGSILQRARSLAPVDTGKLRSSLDLNLSLSHDHYEAEVGTNLYYAIYMEYGTGIYSTKGSGRKVPWMYYSDGRWWWTRGNRPKPYLTPAYDYEKNRIVEDLRREMRSYA
jgi:HK97 gp10 family phage protein